MDKDLYIYIYIIFIITKLRADFLILYLYKKNEYRKEFSSDRGFFFCFTKPTLRCVLSQSARLFRVLSLATSVQEHTSVVCIAVLNGVRWIDFSSATCVLSHTVDRTLILIGR